MKKLGSVAVILGVILLGSGCASIVSKSRWPVSINSNPEGAAVTVKNREGMEVHKGITPTTATLSSYGGFFSSADYQCYFEKDGYSPSTSPLSSRLNGWYFGNLLFGGCIGLLLVDPATGAMWQLDSTVYGNLSPYPNSPTNSIKSEVMPTTLAPQTATTVEDVPAKLKKLKELKDLGTLTDEEYELKRKALVEQL